MRKNTSPKSRVVELASIAYPDRVIEVRGTRVRGRFGGHFLTEISVGDRVVARSRHTDWRKSYKGLEIELAKSCVF